MKKRKRKADEQPIVGYDYSSREMREETADALFRRAGGEEVVQSGEISQPPFLLNTRNRTLEKNGQRGKSKA